MHPHHVILQWSQARRSSWRRATPLALALCAAACGPATGGDAELWAPARGVSPGEGGAGGGSSGAGVAGSGGGDAATGASASSGTGSGSGPALTVRFTTVSFNGEYAPENVGAVLISDSGGGFVMTLALWAT
jgi:hypothetical protein